MNTLNQTELATVLGGENPIDGAPPVITGPSSLDQLAYDLFIAQLQQQADAAALKAWQEFMGSQAA